MGEVLSFADVSFLVSLYLPRPGTASAVECVTRLKCIGFSAPVRFEFENAIRHLAFYRRHDHTQGLDDTQAMTILGKFEDDLEQGVLRLIACDLEEAFAGARRLSERYTWREGFRAFDILHVATAKAIGATHFLTFDKAQRALAEAEGLDVSL